MNSGNIGPGGSGKPRKSRFTEDAEEASGVESGSARATRRSSPRQGSEGASSSSIASRGAERPEARGALDVDALIEQAKAGDRDARKALIRYAVEPGRSKEDRWQVLDVFVNLLEEGDGPARKMLVKRVLGKSPHAEDRVYVFEIFLDRARRGIEKAERVLYQVARKSKYSDDRSTALEAIKELASQRVDVVNYLKSLVLEGKYDDIRQGALDDLVRLVRQGSVATLPHLTDVVLNSPNPGFRSEAIAVMVELAEAGEDVVPYLKDIVESDNIDADERGLAVRGIVYFDASRVLSLHAEKLLEVVASCSVPGDRVDALELCADLARRRNISALMSLGAVIVLGVEGGFRLRALDALLELGDSGSSVAFDALLGAFKDEAIESEDAQGILRGVSRLAIEEGDIDAFCVLCDIVRDGVYVKAQEELLAQAFECIRQNDAGAALLELGRSSGTGISREDRYIAIDGIMKFMADGTADDELILRLMKLPKDLLQTIVADDDTIAEIEGAIASEEIRVDDVGFEGWLVEKFAPEQRLELANMAFRERLGYNPVILESGSVKTKAPDASKDILRATKIVRGVTLGDAIDAVIRDPKPWEDLEKLGVHGAIAYLKLRVGGRLFDPDLALRYSAIRRHVAKGYDPLFLWEDLSELPKGHVGQYSYLKRTIVSRAKSSHVSVESGSRVDGFLEFIYHQVRLGGSTEEAFGHALGDLRDEEDFGNKAELIELLQRSSRQAVGGREPAYGWEDLEKLSPRAQILYKQRKTMYLQRLAATPEFLGGAEGVEARLRDAYSRGQRS